MDFSETCKGSRSRHLFEFMKVSIEGQGHFFTIYFPGFVCFMLYLDKISGDLFCFCFYCGLTSR